MDIITILVNLLGGMSIFLLGMEQLTDSLKKVAGGGLKNALAQLTTNRFKAVLSGAIVTAIIQSSSVTTVLVVGFMSAGLMTLPQSIGLILGADIGTTLTVQIISFKVTKYALVLVTVGFAFSLITPLQRWRSYGSIILGIGLIFLGMELMSQATAPLRDYPPFIDLMKHMATPWVGILIGTLFTALIHSSAVTIGLVIVLASQGFITLEAGIALTFGANIGTCSTALLATIGKPRPAVQAAVAHVLFKVIGVMIWYPFIAEFAWLVRALSPAAPEFISGAALLAQETPRQIANAHTLFNVANTFIFIWFTTPFAHFIEWLLPANVTSSKRTSYLEKLLLKTPDLALDRVRLELEWLGLHALRMTRLALPTVLHGDPDDLTALQQLDDEIDQVHGDIITYLGQLSQEKLFKLQAKQVHHYLSIANYIENIGDMIQTNLVDSGRHRLAHGIEISPETEAILTALHDRVGAALELALAAITKNDKDLSQQVMAAKDEINRLAETAELHLTRRLTVDEPHRLDSFRLESELIEYLKRMYYFAKRMAKIVAESSAPANSPVTKAPTRTKR